MVQQVLFRTFIGKSTVLKWAVNVKHSHENRLVPESPHGDFVHLLSPRKLVWRVAEHRSRRPPFSHHILAEPCLHALENLPYPNILSWNHVRSIRSWPHLDSRRTWRNYAGLYYAESETALRRKGAAIQDSSPLLRHPGEWPHYTPFPLLAPVERYTAWSYVPAGIRTLDELHRWRSREAAHGDHKF